jgi:hypothetical protein
MKLVSFFFLGCVVLLVIGCATIPEPKTESDRLVIGMIIQTGEGFRNYSGATVNGTHKSGIELSIKNTSTNEEYNIKTQKNGLFYTTVLTEGTYVIEQFYLKVTSGNAWADTYSSPNDSWTFTIINGKINNLGVINWDGKARGGTNFKFSQLYNDVVNEFNSQFSKSEWTKWDMVDINIERK